MATIYRFLAESISRSSPAPNLELTLMTDWTLKNEGAFASVCVQLPAGSFIHCESDAVVSMSSHVEVKGKLAGGLLASFARAVFTRETFFTTEVRSIEDGDVLVAPSDPGGVVLHRMVRGEELTLTSGAYLAGDGGVTVSSDMQNPFSGFTNFGGTGVFLLRASGQGNLALSAYGSIIKYTLRPGEKRSVDNGHLVAWSANMRAQMILASRKAGVLGSLTSGEGLHVEFEGPGTLYIQSHKPPQPSDVRHSNRNGGASSGNPFIGCVVFLVFGAVVLGFILAFYLMNESLAPNGRGYGYSGGHYGYDL